MMNPQERDTLTRFLDQLTSAPSPQKVAEADTLIREAITKQPDAAYLLVQRAILLEQALNSAKAQIAQLQNQAQTAQSGAGNSFLGANPWAQGSNTTSQSVPGAGQYQMPRQTLPYSGTQMNGGGSSGFLGSIASTAAGVVAGSFLFQGIENMMGHHSGGGFFGDNAPSEQASGETIINNYYETPPDQDLAQGNDYNGFLASDDSDFIEDDGNDSDWV